MKAQFISRYYGWLILIMLTNGSFAQKAEGLKAPPSHIATSTTTELNRKLQKAIQHNFKDAQSLRWYEVDKRFLVKFIMNEQENVALFTKNGYMVYQITYGEEKHLPYEIRKLVKSSYFDHNIKVVFKIYQDRRTIWLINMEKDSKLAQVRVEDGEMEEIKQ